LLSHAQVSASEDRQLVTTNCKYAIYLGDKMRHSINLLAALTLFAFATAGCSQQDAASTSTTTSATTESTATTSTDTSAKAEADAAATDAEATTEVKTEETKETKKSTSKKAEKKGH
jgi:hypothetical protein